MAKCFKKNADIASDKLQDHMDNLGSQAKDFIKNHKNLSVNDVKKDLNGSLKKASQQLDNLEGPYIVGFSRCIKARPLSAVFFSLLTGFVFGRLSK